MTKKLFIHIGSHKTGTTSIQKALVSNKIILARNGLSYFYQNPDYREDILHNVNTWFEKFPLGIRCGFTINKIQDLSERLAQINSNVIISGESFSWIFQKYEIKKLKTSFEKYFKEIEIVVYLRRQEQQIISHYNQSSKYFDAPARFVFGSIPTVLPDNQEYYRSYIDYNKKLSMWSEVFGKENIKIRIFEKDKLVNGDVVADFFDLLGIKDFKNTISVNESNGLEKTKIGLLMNQSSIANGPLRNIINQNLDRKNKFLPKRAEAEEFYAQYRESNIALNNMFNISKENEAIFNEDFSMYPEEGNELWTEEIVNDTILKIFKNLNESYGNINYNAIYQSALKLEKVDFKLSYELMKILERLIPNDQNIKNKIQIYNNKAENRKNN